MTKEISKAIILQEMQDKFKLRDLIPEKFTFSESVIPTYNIEQHIQHQTARHLDKSITAGPAGYAFFTVDGDERWTLRGYNVVFMAAGAYTVTGVYITRKLEIVANSVIYLDMTLGQTVSYAINLPEKVTLEPGDKIAIYVDGYTSTADLRLYIDYTLEKIR